MGEDVNAVNTTTEAPVTESAPVEESTVDNSMESSEKTEITQEGQQGNQVVGDDASQSVPKARLDEVIKERNELREFKARQEAQRQEQERLANMTPQQQAQEEQMKKAKEALRKMGVVTSEDLQRIQQQEAVKNMFISEMNRLESVYNGKDGNPVFKPQEIAEFMDEQAAKGNRITDPETAYKLKNFDAIVDARVKAQKSTPYAEKQSGGVQEVNDTRGTELDAAAKTGNMRDFLKKYAGMPKSN